MDILELGGYILNEYMNHMHVSEARVKTEET